MDDHEFVLGFIAFTQVVYDKYPAQKVRNYFLHEAMRKLNRIDKDSLDEIESKFIFAMIVAYNIFGSDTFRKITDNPIKQSPVNKALF